MAEVRCNNQQGFLGTALTAVPAGTQQSITNLFAQAPGFPSLNVGDYIKLSLDAFSTNFEIIYLIGPYTAGSLNGIITRAAEDSTNWPAGNHLAGTGTWGNDPTVADFTNTTTQPPLTNNTTFGSTAYTDLAVGVETARAEAAEALHITNPNSYNFPYLHRALANIQSGVAGDRKIALIGDSTVYGDGGLLGIGPCLTMAKLLTAQGYPAAVGMDVPPHPPLGYGDTQWSVGAGWTQPNASAFAWGGINTYFSGVNGTAADTLTFTPSSGYAYDTVDIWYFQEPFASHFDARIDNAAPTTFFPGNPTALVTKATITSSVATNHVVKIGNITGGSGGPVRIIGIEPHLSTTPKLRIANLGASGATTGSWTTTTNAPEGPLDCIKAYAPDTSFIYLGINDAGASVPTSTYLANLLIVVQACQLTGDCIVIGQIQSSPSGTYQAYEALYNAALGAFCATNKCGFLDIYTAWGGANGYAALNPLGYYYDALHPSLNVGYPDASRLMVNALIGA